MERLAHAHAYFDGWNAHDAEAIAATFAPGGTYTDPTRQGSRARGHGRVRRGPCRRLPGPPLRARQRVIDGRRSRCRAVGHAGHQQRLVQRPSSHRPRDRASRRRLHHVRGWRHRTVTGYFDGARRPARPRPRRHRPAVRRSVRGRSASRPARRRPRCPRRGDQPDLPRGAHRRGGRRGAPALARDRARAAGGTRIPLVRRR